MRKWVIFGIILIVFTTILFFTLSAGNTQYPKIDIHYKIKPQNIREKKISVNIRICTNNSEREIRLAKSLFNTISSECVDDKGNKIPFNDNERVITIGPISKDVKYIDYSYETTLGNMLGGKAKGDIYEDLMVFSGEDVLLFPFINEEDFDSISRYIDQITIEVQTKDDWNSVIPFQQNICESNKVTIKKPDWHVLYNLAKSCYAFGKFECLPINTIDGTFDFFVDAAYKHKLTSENVTTMSNIYNYYVQVFGEGLEDYPVVLLRSEESQGLPILGGVGGKSMGISFEMKTGEDWYTFSRTLYHAFFDSKIHARNLHFPPNLWLYKGLAEYYVDKSASVIPANVRSKYGIVVNDSLDDIYNRYLYFTLKEPMLNVTPAHEDFMLMAQSEYYYHTKVPLIINEIENILQKRNGTTNNLISILMKYSNEEHINFAKIMTELLGSEEETIRAYLAGEEIIPYFRKSPEKENMEKVLLELDQYERYLTLLFQKEVEEFPYDPVILLKPEILSKEIQNQKLKFGSETLHQKVRNYSETIYLLLMQHSLRADICGENDLASPEIRFTLNNSENIKKWVEYINKVGLYGSL